MFTFVDRHRICEDCIFVCNAHSTVLFLLTRGSRNYVMKFKLIPRPSPLQCSTDLCWLWQLVAVDGVRGGDEMLVIEIQKHSG